VRFLFFVVGAEKVANTVLLVRAMDLSTVITLGGVQISKFGEHAWFAIIIVYMIVVVALAA
jgi:hypothetical protein